MQSMSANLNETTTNLQNAETQVSQVCCKLKNPQIIVWQAQVS